MIPDFDLAADLPPNGTLIQASAGTGKTYSVAALVTLAIAEDPGLRIGNVLVTTYTRNAVAELRERIRDRMLAAARLLRGGAPPPGWTPDPLDDRLLADTGARIEKARRLERAVAEFDTATIGTMHSICAAILRLAGVPAADTGDEDLLDRVIAEVVNDAIVAETAVAGEPAASGDGEEPRWQPRWNEGAVQELVRKSLGDPFILPWYDPTGRTSEQRESLDKAVAIVTDCVAAVHARMLATPSYDDLLRRARDEVKGDDSRTKTFRESLQAKYRLGIVDEAQDTSRLQWEFLHLIFPPDAEDRLLIAVGDPKQAIYGFRGADVTAYLRFAQGRSAAAGTPPPQRTLRVNRRSDGPLLRGLNRTMDGATFGAGIDYEEVAPAADRSESRVHGLHPVEFVNCGEVSLVDAAVAKVYELLTTDVFLDTRRRPFRPGEIAVLCRFNEVGNAVADALRRLFIPAVTTGTATVMAGQTATDLRRLLEAMERPSDAGRARLAAATAFFARPLTRIPPLSEAELQEIQEMIAEWHGVLQGRGVAAMAGHMMADGGVATRLASGREGERRVVDFGHVVELLHDATDGRGCAARVVLEHVATLARKDPKSDTVSRRVESDEDAVRIMTVHMAKGLQFPAVVVVDAWAERRPRKSDNVAVFYDADRRLLDVGTALEGIGNSDRATQSVTAAANEETCRLLYVAVTRPRHHVSVLRPDAWRESLIARVMPGAPEDGAAVPDDARDAIGVREAGGLPAPTPWTKPEEAARDNPPVRGTAPLPRTIEQTYRRTSFSTIKKAAVGASPDHHSSPGQGNDEDGAWDDDDAPATATDPGATAGDRRAAAADLAAFTIDDLPGGTAFGNVVHEIFERLDVEPGQSADAVVATVGRLVDEVARSKQLQERKGAIVRMIVDSLTTPFGGSPTSGFHALRLLDFSRADRLVEMDFEMGLADVDRRVRVSDVGRLLRDMTILPESGPLRGYAEHLSSGIFDVPLAGLINGQIDAVLRIPGRPADDPRLIITDYKTNRLHRADDATPLAAYGHERMAAEMQHSEYLLQALIYGTALWRMLRWRLGPRKPSGWDPGACIAGIVYAFVRGMKGPDTPVDAENRRFGVFTWQPAPLLWRHLSDLLAGKTTGGCP